MIDVLTSIPYFVPALGAMTAPGTPYDQAQGLVSELALLLIPVCIGIALVREQLFDVDVLIRRTVLYGALSLLLALAYAAVVVGAGATTGAAGGPVPALLGALAVALLLQPIRSLLQHRTQRLLLGMREDRYEALTALGHRFSASVSPDDVPERRRRRHPHRARRALRGGRAAGRGRHSPGRGARRADEPVGVGRHRPPR